MKYLSDKEVASGLMFLVIGLIGLGLSFTFEIGRAAHPGPGFFPVLLSSILVLIGLAVTIGGLRGPVANFPKIAWRPLLLILCSVLVFALGIEQFGLMPVVFAAALVATFAKPDFGLISRILTAMILSVFTAALFVGLLRLPIALWAM